MEGGEGQGCRGKEGINKGCREGDMKAASEGCTDEAVDERRKLGMEEGRE